MMKKFVHIDIISAQEMIDSQEVSIIDIRDQEAFLTSHIEGAQNVGQWNIEEYVQNANKAKPLICYCYYGMSSQSAAHYFIEQGFEQVYSLDGGYEAWKK